MILTQACEKWRGLNRLCPTGPTSYQLLINVPVLVTTRLKHITGYMLHQDTHSESSCCCCIRHISAYYCIFSVNIPCRNMMPTREHFNYSLQLQLAISFFFVKDKLPLQTNSCSQWWNATCSTFNILINKELETVNMILSQGEAMLFWVQLWLRDQTAWKTGTQWVLWAWCPWYCSSPPPGWELLRGHS